MSKIRIGISGWRYAGWRKVFYPPGLPQSEELAYAAQRMQTIEINGSHYSLQTPDSYQRWHDATPDDFVFSVKGPRYLTHMLRFRGAGSNTALANFFASGLFRLGRKLGPLLWQFPPNLAFDPSHFESILSTLPRNTDQAAELARRHDERVAHPCTEPLRRSALRHAIEVRHESFCDPAFIRLLRRYRHALVISDSVADWPYAEDITAQFTYLRLHGTETLYGGEYGDAALDRWSDRIKQWAQGQEPADARRIADLPARQRKGRDIYCYFDNDIKVQAPVDAQRLMQRLER